MDNNIREMLNNIRSLKDGSLNENTSSMNSFKIKLNEDIDNDTAEDAVPYAKDDDIYTTSTESAKSGFSAKFPESNPVLYYPSEDDVVMSGTIPSLKNAKFRFSHKDSTGQGCYIWVDSLQLTDEVLGTLNKVLGVFKNWKDSLNKIDDLRPMSMEK